MPGPKPPALVLAEDVRSALQKFSTKHSTPQQLAWRAKLILGCADGLNNSQVAHAHDTDPDAVRFWRSRWLAVAAIPLPDLSIEERLADAPRAGKKSAISPEQFCQIVALACEAPEKSGRPITQWSGSEIAKEIVARGILPSISPRHALRLLKKGISNPTASGAGSPR
ncbi:helix-turn-helix domain-containing protein [Gloeobacter kilaueensis]|uniref:Transposase n=1 Tax=Gloeobacter kilaueensis (strain ATCC BAA-2537 / CCAP 1431/1 / ULC 316 / JS1) TaxID=1183438 RepID=U5QLW1_GLOK1|nr:helix-turn-helix domain-containing protein [Gloeobacter kilaueensis]AGY57910.1 transposase [Gloeobacter kilaueensis JS1]AGY59099.1 transposase [Gloeobacter kilaueensis JS1]AGY59268.1 transposase [Gloeobacter kilaueensis JS1]AGY59972.1 transposase [Gloeobacter kilaueensis JS1]